MCAETLFLPKALFEENELSDNYVQQAVAEAMKAQWPAAPSQDTQKIGPKI